MHPLMVSFPARWDRQLRLSTPLSCALVLALVLFWPSGRGWVWLINIALLVTVAGIWAWAPRLYKVEGDELIIRRLIGSVRIPLSGLRIARLMSPDELRGATRTWAVVAVSGTLDDSLMVSRARVGTSQTDSHAFAWIAPQGLL